MPTYILLSNLTAQGVQTLKSNPDRLREVNKDVEALGARSMDGVRVNLSRLADARIRTDAITRARTVRPRSGGLPLVSAPRRHAPDRRCRSSPVRRCRFYRSLRQSTSDD